MFFVPTAMYSRLVRAGDARRAGWRSVVVAAAPWELRTFFVPAARRDMLAFGRLARVTRDAQVTAMSSWRLPPGSSACCSCPPRCTRVRSLGGGDARRAVSP